MLLLVWMLVLLLVVLVLGWLVLRVVRRLLSLCLLVRVVVVSG